MTTAATFVLLVTAVPLCLVATARGTTIERLVGLEVMGVLTTAVLLLLARVSGRPVYLDVALVTALVSFAGSLVFVRFVGRSL